MTDLTDDQVRALLKKAGSGPWDVDGPVWNRTVWRSSENRVCFMAHSNGLDDDRDIATSELVAAAPDLARALLAARADAELAVAEAIRRAAEEAASEGWPGENCFGVSEREEGAMDCAYRIETAILTLVPADALAEVQRMREERDAALAQMKKLREAGLGLKSIVEGIQGAMEHGTWRAERSNLRMKDTEEWVTFYNVMTALDEDARHG